MNRKCKALFFCCALLSLRTSALQGEDAPPPSPEVVAQELEKAEHDFKVAKKMFNPWYTGPLITPSATLIPPHSYNIQPYLYYINNYATFDNHGHSHNIHHLKTVNPQVVFQAGLFKRVQGIAIVQGLTNWQNGHSATHFGDSTVGLGVEIFAETPYRRPAVLFSLQETLPTGRYQHLKSDKPVADSTGGGSYKTTFGLDMSKVLWWFSDHPMNVRLALNYTLATKVAVRGFNTYGGGYGTHGTVNPGNTFAMDFGYEFSLSEPWVLALDVVYTYSNKTKFSGDPGTLGGLPAAVGSPFSQQLSFAPALEYNVNENLGFIGGVWFAPWGQNALKFVSGIASVTYSF